MSQSNEFNLGIGTIFIAVILIIGLVVGLSSYTVIPAGSKGVVFSKSTGIQSYTLTEGFHLKTPIIDEIIKIDVRTKKLEKKIFSTSKDQQEVTVNVAINYKPNSDKVNNLYQEIGLDYVNRILVPAMEESIKYAMAQYKAEELLTKRQEVSILALEKFREKIDGKYIIIENVNLVNIDFSSRFNTAIESKVIAEQEAEREKNVLEREKIKKETLIVQAEAQKEKSILEAQGRAEAMLLERQAEAEGIELIKEASKDSDEVVQLRMVDNWNGALPQIISGENSGLLMGIDSLNKIKE